MNSLPKIFPCTIRPLALFVLTTTATSCVGGAHKLVSPRVYELYSAGDIDATLDRIEKELQEAQSAARAEAMRVVEAAERKLGPIESAKIDKRVSSQTLEALRTLRAYAADAATEQAAELSVSQLNDHAPELPPNEAESLPNSANNKSTEDNTTSTEGDTTSVAADTTTLGFQLSNIEKLKRERKLSREVKAEILAVEASSAKYIVSREPYFSVGSVVAFDNELDATAIPVAAYNLYPFSGASQSLGVQAVFGGALSGSNGGTDIGLAIGAGGFVPVGPSGSLSFGHILWDESGNGQNGWYIGLNIGGSSKSTDLSP